VMVRDGGMTYPNSNLCLWSLFALPT
jgi:hypothetical protein